MRQRFMSAFLGMDGDSGQLGEVRESMLRRASPVLMLISGATAPNGEICLVASHRARPSTGLVKMEPCKAALRSGEGRELWQLDPGGHLRSFSAGLCIAVSRDNSENNGLVLAPCSSDDPSIEHLIWEPTADNQLKISSQTSSQSNAMCLIVPSPGPETAQSARNLALKQPVSASSSSPSHDAARAVDGREASYWASAEVDEHGASVTGGSEAFTVQVPRSNLESVDIDWELPPRAFDLEIKDGLDWHIIKSVEDNPMHSKTSHIQLDGQPADGIRLRLHVPDAVNGVMGGRFYFGIRRIQANVAPDWSQPMLQRCADAAESPIAGDKWFLDQVSQFDPANAILARDGAHHVSKGVQPDPSWVPLQESTRQVLEQPGVHPQARLASAFLLSVGDTASGSPLEDLRPLTRWRQQHRRTMDGLLCSAAGVKSRMVFTGCTNTASPEGVMGRPWCYIEPTLRSVLPSGRRRWGYCAPISDFDQLREYFQTQ